MLSSNSIEVYWGVEPKDRDYPTVSYFDPVPAIKNFIDIEGDAVEANFKFCPAIHLQQKNVFKLKFPYQYKIDFDWENQYCSSPYYDQDFFDDNISVRSFQCRTIGIQLYPIFISEEPLEIEMTQAYTSDNNFVRNTILFPGQFDIGRWARPLSCDFIVRKGFNFVEFDRGDDWSFIKFKTDKKIIFKKFYCTQEIKQLYSQNIRSRDYKIKVVEKLSYYYDMFEQSRHKNRLLKLIKENLL